MLKRLAVIVALAPTLCSAAEVDIRFAPGSFGSGDDFQRNLEQAVRGNGVRIVASDPAAGTARLETSDAGRQAMQADPRFTVVRGTSPSSAPDPTAAADWTQWRLTIAGRGRQTALTAERATTGATAPMPKPPRPGQLLVIARDAAGNELARTIADDPRIIRYEAVDAAGRFTERRDLPIGTGGDIIVSLPADARIMRIDIEDAGVPVAGVTVQ